MRALAKPSQSIRLPWKFLFLKKALLPTGRLQSSDGFRHALFISIGLETAGNFEDWASLKGSGFPGGLCSGISQQSKQ